MAREKETFRLELEQLIAAYPQRAVLTRTDIMNYTGRGRKWLDSHGFTGKEYTRTDVAHTLCVLHEKQERRKRA